MNDTIASLVIVGDCAQAESVAEQLALDSYAVDDAEDGPQLRFGSHCVQLRLHEYALLVHLTRDPLRVCSTGEFLREVWVSRRARPGLSPFTPRAFAPS